MKRIVYIILFICILPFSLYGEIPLISAVEEMNLFLQWDPGRQTGILRGYGKSYTFKPGKSWGILNFTGKVTGIDIYRERGGMYISKEGEEKLRELFGIDEFPADVPRVAAILLDPGHGGKDPGTIGTHDLGDKKLILKEKDLVLDVALDLYSRLTEEYPGKKILLTRKDDTFPTLEKRVELANSIQLSPYEAIIFVSVHANASLNTKAKGFEVWYLPPEYRRTVIDPEDVESEEILPILNTMLEEEYTVESVLLAQKVLEGLDAQVGEESENRGIKEESWFVVRNAKMPSILIEIGFVTNKEEARKLAQNEYLMKLSEGIYNGITNFVTYFEKTKGFTE